MTLDELIEDIKLDLTGGVTSIEIPDEALERLIKTAMKELQRYCDESTLITIPFSKCIDLKEFPISSVIAVYRTEGIGGNNSRSDSGISDMDPMYAQRWAMYASGNMYSLHDWILSYASYATLQQLQNSVSTDLSYHYDKHDEKLYINTLDNPSMITLEYIPIFDDVEKIKTDYWQDILRRLSVAYVKKALGRIRTKYKQTNALWDLDGETLLEEGNTELSELREILRVNSQLFIPVD